MNKFFKVQSKGEMPIEAFTLMGASSKRGDATTIGEFGTGLKYALVVLMRDNIPFTLCTGKTEYEFGTETASLKGKRFQQLRFRKVGKGNRWNKLHFTTSMGLKWKFKHAMREIIANAYDEDRDASIEIVEDKEPKEGFTTFAFPASKKMITYFKMFDRNFCMRRTPEHEFGVYRLYKKNRGSSVSRVYMQGVLVSTLRYPSLYDYEIQSMDLMEDRTVGESEVKEGLCRLIDKAPMDLKLTFVKEVQKNPKLLEANCPRSWQGFYSADWDEIFSESTTVISVAEAKAHKKSLKGKKNVEVLPDKWKDKIIGQTPAKAIDEAISEVEYAQKVPVEMTEEFQDSLIPALAVLESGGYEIPWNNIALFEADGEDLVTILDNKIFLSTGIQDFSCRKIQEILLLEHLKMNTDKGSLAEKAVSEIVKLLNKLVIQEKVNG